MVSLRWRRLLYLSLFIITVTLLVGWQSFITILAARRWTSSNLSILRLVYSYIITGMILARHNNIIIITTYYTSNHEATKVSNEICMLNFIFETIRIVVYNNYIMTTNFKVGVTIICELGRARVQQSVLLFLTV